MQAEILLKLGIEIQIFEFAELVWSYRALNWMEIHCCFQLTLLI